MKDKQLFTCGYAIGSQWQSNLWTQYKLNTSDWRKLWERQGGKCAGCGDAFAHPLDRSLEQGIKSEVDHRHVEGRRCETQDVRGLLCRRCNDFLGKIQDNRRVLQNLLNYLKAHGDY